MHIRKGPAERILELAFFGSASLGIAILVVAVPGISLILRIFMALGSCFLLVGMWDAFVPAHVVIHSPRWREKLAEWGRVIFGGTIAWPSLSKLVGGLAWLPIDWLVMASALVIVSHGVFHIATLHRRPGNISIK